MQCISQGGLRAYLDGELVQEQAKTEEHLAGCGRCREKLARLRQVAASAESRLAAVSLDQAGLDASQALARVWDRGQVDRTSIHRRDGIMGKKNRRAVASGALVLALLIGVFSLAPGRALARQFLSIFRVRKFAVVQISPDQARLERLGQELQDNLFIDGPEVIADEPVVQVASWEEARRVAGFEVRMPQVLADSALQFEVKGRTELRLPFQREGLVSLLQLAGMDTNSVPDDWEQGEIRATAPAMAYIKGDDLEVIQVKEPGIEYPDGLNPQMVGEAGLILLGLDPKDAKDISARIDWTSTLLLPIPADIATFEETRVAGEQAIFLRSSEPSHHAVFLLWEKGGTLYLISGHRSLEGMVEAAESMF